MPLAKPSVYRKVGTKLIPLVTPDRVIDVELRREHAQRFPEVPVVPEIPVFEDEIVFVPPPPEPKPPAKVEETAPAAPAEEIQTITRPAARLPAPTVSYTPPVSPDWENWWSAGSLHVEAADLTFSTAVIQDGWFGAISLAVSSQASITSASGITNVEHPLELLSSTSGVQETFTDPITVMAWESPLPLTSLRSHHTIEAAAIAPNSFFKFE